MNPAVMHAILCQFEKIKGVDADALFEQFIIASPEYREYIRGDEGRNGLALYIERRLAKEAKEQKFQEELRQSTDKANKLRRQAEQRLGKTHSDAITRLLAARKVKHDLELPQRHGSNMEPHAVRQLKIQQADTKITAIEMEIGQMVQKELTRMEVEEAISAKR